MHQNPFIYNTPATRLQIKFYNNCLSLADHSQEDFMKRSNFNLIVSLWLVLLMHLPSIAFSADPLNIFTFQGQLNNADGSPISSTLNMTFKLYGNQNNCLWTESKSVSIIAGDFDLMLGKTESNPIPFTVNEQARYIGLTVGSDPEMEPRQEIGGVLRAGIALSVTDASITSSKLADSAVTSEKLSDNTVTSSKLAGYSGALSAGTAGQSLQSNGDGTFAWANVIPDVVPASNLTGTISPDRFSALDDLVVEGAAGVSISEIGYLNGVTSAIQAQLDSKLSATSPTFSGTTNFNGSQWSSFVVMGNTTTAQKLYFSICDNYAKIHTAGSSILMTNSGQHIGIGSQYSSSYQLYCNGNAANSTGSWATISDKRLKKNIKPISDALNKISQLKGICYEWIHPDEHDNQTGIRSGFIAQDVEKYFPNWVADDTPRGKDKKLISKGEKIKTLQFSYSFNAYIIEAIKEIKAEKDKEIKLLKEENEKLKAEFNVIKEIFCMEHQESTICQ
jgi:hypothetical protein